MKKQIKRIIPHFVKREGSRPLADDIADFHANVIENRLERLNLSSQQSIEIIDMIIEKIKSSHIHSTT